jgi:hypothetical protein
MQTIIGNCSCGKPIYEDLPHAVNYGYEDCDNEYWCQECLLNATQIRTKFFNLEKEGE